MIGVALNTTDCTVEEAFQYKQEISAELQLPLSLPLEEGMDELITELKKLV